MPQMETKVAHRYGGRELSVGDKFEAEDRHVRVLIAQGKAMLVDGGGYQTTHIATSPETKQHQQQRHSQQRTRRG